MPAPEIQQGWRVVRQGPPNKALAFQTFPVPRIRSGEVLVKVEAAALNPVGYKLMQLLPNILSRRPHVAEHDFTGIIVDAGTSDYKVGDAVLGFIPAPVQQKNGQGALAQYISISTEYIVPRPPSLVATQAAGLSLAGVTAYLAITQFLEVESGQHILINGGSSSVGSLAIQIAKARGCNVTTSCSAANIDLVKSLGADEVVDYTAQPVHAHFTSNPPSPKFHGIFDCVGNTPQLFLRSPAYLAPNGKFISTGPSMDKFSQFPSTIWNIVQTSLWPRWLGGVPRHHETIVALTSIDKCLHDITKLVDNGQLRPLVDSVHSFDEVLKAYDRILTRRAKGKVVVTIN
ncbi:alcohol dehydrogenase [Rhizoctonia solani AG-1 IB]|uniref:Alcohol dehydrogenase n=1 Tax=Thanatephorus cucumeris (strain AG1-IB / isolate 7/3/14) TaxID=1108050 RepID=A0A0B7F3K7_THACB|nr:alcohol dehydrogenase [Rhizoctonia solani AG-1 IB]